MSMTIDQKIVEMRFDNKQFEENVSESISTLDKLKASLNFDKVGEAFSTLSSAAGKVDLSGISIAVETVTSKFSMLEVAAITACQNIVNKGINWLESNVKALTLDQPIEGWNKYNEKTESVQTIMAATGKSIDEVSAQLARLNWFSDETSYSFNDMTSNVGKFTSSGVELETAVSAMEGISTWAAISGQNTGTAARAMYNMAQALAVGSVKLMDWRSIENANMATVEFKQTVIDTAESLGTLKKTGEGTWQTLKGTTVTVKDFNSALSQGWFSNEVLLASLDKYGAFANELSKTCEETGITATKLLEYIDEYKEGTLDLEKIAEETGVSAENLKEILETLGSSEYELGRKAFKAAQEAKTFKDAIDATKDAVSTGWMSTFEYLFGNYEQAKSFFTDMANLLWDIFAASGEIRNEILSQWADLGGGDLFREGLLNILESVANVVSFIHDILAEIGIIPKDTEAGIKSAAETLKKAAENFNRVTGKLKEFTENAEASESVVNRLKSVWKGFKSVIDIFRQALGALSPIFNVVKNLAFAVADSLLTLFGAFGDYITSIGDYIRQNDIFTKGLEKLRDLLSPVTEKLKELYSSFKEKIDFSGFGRFSETLGRIEQKLEPVKNFFDGIFKSLKEFLGQFNFSQIFADIWHFISSIGTSIGDLLSKINFTSIANGIGTVFEALFNGFRILFRNFNLGDLLSSFGKGLGDLFSSVGTLDLSNLTKQLTKGAMIFGGFNLSKLFGSASGALDGLTGDKKGIGNIFKDLFSPVTDVFDQLKETIGSFTKDTDSGKLKSIAIAIGILAVALVALSSVDAEAMDVALKGVTAAFIELGAEMKWLSTIDPKKSKGLKNVGTAMIEIAAAVAIIVWALKPLAEMNWEQLGKMGAALTVLLGEMLAFTAIFGAISRANTSGKGLFQKSNGFDKQLKKVAEAMVVLGVAIKIFAWAAKDFGNMEIDAWRKAIRGISIVMVEMGLFTFAMSKVDTTGIVKTAASMVILGIAMKTFASAAQAFGKMSTDEIIGAIGMMTFVMIEMGFFMVAADRFVSSAGQLAGVAAGMILLGVAMNAFALAAKAFASIDLEKLPGVFAMMLTATGSMMLFIAAVSIFSASAGQIAGIAAGMILLSVAMKSFAVAALMFTVVKWSELGKMGAVFGVLVGALVGMSLLAPQIAILGTALTSVGVAILAIGGGVFLLATAVAMFNLSGLIGQLTNVGRWLGSLSKELTLFAKNARSAFSVSTFVTFLTAIPKAIAGVIAGIISGLGDIFSAIPDLISGLTEAVLAFFEFIADVAPALADTMLGVLLDVLVSITENLPEILVTVMDLILKLLDGLIEYIPQIVEKVVNLLCKVFDSLTEHIPTLLTSFMNFVGALFGEILTALDNSSPDAILKMIEFVGFLAILVVACAALKAIIPGAMVGLILLGAFTAELAVILAALGALNSIPGFQEMVGSGGNLLEAIGNAIGKFVGGIVGGIGEGITDSLPAIADNLSAFMEHLQPFIDGVAAIDQSVVDNVACLASAILKLTAAELISGLMSFITGKTSFESFGEALASFGPNVKQFADTVKGIDTDAVTASTAAIRDIAEAFGADTFKTGGLKQWFTGELSDLKAFGNGLVTLGPDIMAYAESVKGLDNNVVKNSTEGAKALAEMADKLPKRNGLKQLFEGDTDLVAFAKGVSDLAPSLVSYANTVKGLDNDVVTKSVIACEALAELEEKLPNKSFVDTLFGRDAMTEFAGSLVSFGEGIASYYLTISTIDAEHMNSVTDAVRDLVDMVSAKKNVTLKIDRAFADSMKEIAQKGVTSFIEVIETSHEQVNTKGQEFVTKFKSGIEAKKKEPETAFSTIIANIKALLQKKRTELRTEGEMLILSFRNGMDAQKTYISKSMTDIMDTMISAITQEYTLFYEYGSAIAGQFISGVNDRVEEVGVAAAAMAQAAINAVKSKLEVASPSQVFFEIGVNAGKGFANGIYSWISKVKNVSDQMGESSTETITDAINESLQNEVNADPVIRPVLDLSDIESKSEVLDNIFSTNRALKANSYTAAASASLTGNTVNNATSYGGFTFNIYTQGTDADDIVRQIGAEVNRRVRAFS